MNSQDPEKLEASIHRVLRSIPDRRAPAALGADLAAHFDASRPHRLSAGRGDAELLVVSADAHPDLTSIKH